eukprot:jgi/Galph1/2556/GphlegSOOS_G1189.1
MQPTQPPKDEERYEPILYRFGENEVPKVVQKEAWKACDSLVQVFKECSRNRTFSLAWSCQEELEKMTKCLYDYETDENNIHRAKWEVAKKHALAVKGYRQVKP